ncbi:hypothetical protein R1sor_009110 [Riccia sorocarpa]|uniref:Uncharacterized protein n=1 Tax=Riccia sorocarpa TaxID=122646 RepID=A0ABD3H6T6_9MARC
MSENQLAPTLFLEPTPKRYKKAHKQAVEETTDDDSALLEEPEKKPSTSIVPTLLQEPEQTNSTPIVPVSLEAMIDQILARLATGRKQEAMKAVYELIKTPEAVEAGEAQAILLEIAYHMCEKPKELKDLISTKYLETLRSKVDDVTCIMELEGLLEASRIAAPKRSDGGYTGTFTEMVQAQLGELSRILSVIEGDGPTSAIALTAEERAKMLALVALPTEGDSILSAGSSGR